MNEKVVNINIKEKSEVASLSGKGKKVKDITSKLRKRIFNLPNLLTLCRIAIIPLMVYFYLQDTGAAGLKGDWGKIVAFVLFGIAAITDWIDGYLARASNQITRFGKILDPVADKALVFAAFILLIESRSISLVPGWSLIVILTRDFLVMGVRVYAAKQGIVIAASWLGKLKTVFQMITISVAFFYVTLMEIFISYKVSDRIVSFSKSIYSPLIYSLLGVVLIITIISGIEYVYRNWKLIAYES